MEYRTWDDAFKEGFRLVIHSPGFNQQSHEEDMRRGRIVTKALLAGVDPEWISDMLVIDAVPWIENEIKRRSH